MWLRALQAVRDDVLAVIRQCASASVRLLATFLLDLERWPSGLQATQA